MDNISDRSFSNRTCLKEWLNIRDFDHRNYHRHFGSYIYYGIVIAAIWQDPFKQLCSSPSNIIIASMAACDFLVGLFCSVLLAFWFISLSLDTRIPTNLTLITIVVTACLIGISMLHILALTIDRVIAVANPLLYKSRVTRKRVLVTVFSIWAFYLVIELLQIPLYKASIFQTIAVMVIVGLVEIAVSGLSFYIFISVRKQTKQIQSNTELSGNIRVFMERDRKTTKTILLILAIFLICFPPFLVTWIVLVACFSCKPQLNVILTFFCLSTILANFNSCINPFLYAFRLPKFRKPVALITKRLSPCKILSRADKDTSVSNMQPEKVLH
jgi:hypothetical protein